MFYAPFPFEIRVSSEGVLCGRLKGTVITKKKKKKKDSSQTPGSKGRYTGRKEIKQHEENAYRAEDKERFTSRVNIRSFDIN